MKIGLFGGTFDPPHKGHIAACREFIKASGISFLYVMPTCIPPHKAEDGERTAHRFNMTRLAFSDMPVRTVISATEISRSGKSYSIDTVRKLLAENPGCELYMYVGSDMLFCFEKWKDFEDIFRSVTLVAACRDISDKAETERVSRVFAEKYGARIIVADLSPVKISSTELRESLFRGDSPEKTGFLTDAVSEYITKNGVYANRHDGTSKTDTAANIRAALPCYIDGKRLSHTYEVEKEAVGIARKLNLSHEEISDISAAAYLHDITKNYTEEQHRIYLSQFLKDIGDSVSVFHSWSSAFLGLEKFFISPRVFRAVYNHTTGNSDMEISEKILYLADFIEPTRPHDICKKLRKYFHVRFDAAQSTAEKLKILDETVLLSIYSTSRHLSAENRIISPELFSAKEYFEKITGISESDMPEHMKVFFDDEK